MVERVAEIWRPLRRISYQSEAYDYQLDNGSYAPTATLTYQSTVTNSTGRGIVIFARLLVKVAGVLVNDGATIGLDRLASTVLDAGKTLGFTLHVVLPRNLPAGDVIAQVELRDIRDNTLYDSVQTKWANASQGGISLAPGGFGLG